MNESPDTLFSKYRSKGLLVDANLLLIFVVGSWDRSAVGRFKRTKEYSPEDFDLLADLLYVSRIATTPHILTEVSNLLRQLPEKSLIETYRVFAEKIELLHEDYSASSKLAKEPSFARFGLTDTAIFLEARQRYLVLTDDFHLSGFLTKYGVDCLNFNHIRLSGWT